MLPRLLLFFALSACWPSIAPLGAAQILQMEPEEVIGVQRQKPTKPNPEVFDPLNDERWKAGFREAHPTAIPDELKDVDALTRAKARRRIVACADGWYYPFSRTAPRSEPPGIDIEILRLIAQGQEWKFDIVWANTGVNLGYAFRTTIDKGYCDLFLGLVATGEDTDVQRHNLVFTQPYLGLGFVLAVQGKARAVKDLDELKRAKLKVGVLMFSPMEDYIRANDIDHELYFQNQRLIDGMVKGEVDAGLIWSGALAVAWKDYKADFKMVRDYVPPAGQRWNGAWAVQKSEPQLKQFLDEALTDLLKKGDIRRIVESYHVPFFEPFPD